MAHKKVALECSECGALNYTVPAGKSDCRLSLRKYCKHCGKYTMHRETR